ncbi:MAG: serine hydrolase domain-containing protein [Bdellovibrionales bacterium]|jgi:CubicO group peptidase (beta-lactamase class C family)|nr:serine hydrolase domain-containing protein [Bdellovibrionales bacterium]
MASSVEKEFLRRLALWRHPEDESDWTQATPGFCLQAFQGGRRKLDLAVGTTSEIYDWASVTKIVFGVSALMYEVEAGNLGLRDRLMDWFPELEEDIVKAQVTDLRIRDLLTHSAGMTWWKPFYKSVEKKQPHDHEEAWVALTQVLLRDVKTRLRNGDLKRARKGPAVYSDLDFLLLGEVLRRSSLEPLPDCYERVRKRLDLRETFFHATGAQARGLVPPGCVTAKSRRKMTAPTEYDDRKGRVLQAEVHDENAASLFGISTHAGLFGPIEDLSRYGRELRNLVRAERSKLPAAGASFLKRAVPKARGDWAMGFMMPTARTGSAGPRFSATSIGHTGFTGTSLWYDPKLDLLVTILSNRVHPTRANTRFVKLRPALHTMVVESLSL